MDKKSLLEAIECHMIFGEIEEAEKLKKNYKKKFNKMERDMSILRNQTFEGTLTAIGWDQLDHANKLSLFTPDDEDIILEHSSQVKRFAPYMNKKVKIIGDLTSSEKDGRRVAVRKISKLKGHFTESSTTRRDEFVSLIPDDVA